MGALPFYQRTFESAKSANVCMPVDYAIDIEMKFAQFL